MDYNQLVGSEALLGSVKYWINYSRIDSVGIVSEAQAWIYLRLRVSEMKAIATIPIALDDTSLALPTGYLDPIRFSIPGTIENIRYTDPERFDERLSWDGGSPSLLAQAPPTRWSNIGGRIQLNNRADAAYTGRMIYYKTPDDLTTLAPTNFLTSKYQTLMRVVCTMFAADARKEQDKKQSLQIEALELIDTIKVQDDLGNRGMEFDMNWEARD